MLALHPMEGNSFELALVILPAMGLFQKQKSIHTPNTMHHYKHHNTLYIILCGWYVYASCLAPNIYWENSMNNHVILKEVDVEVMKVIQFSK